MTKEKDKRPLRKFKVIKGLDVSESDIRKALKLDCKYYSIGDSDQFNIEKCLNWKKINPRIYTMIKNEKNDILAYINTAPVTEKCYNDIRQGKYSDVNIDDRDIVPFTKPGFYNLYFASIVIDSDNEGSKAFILLLNAFIEKMINLVKEGFIPSRMIADAISNQGKTLCEKIGMKKIFDTPHSSTIYEFELFPPKYKVISPKLKELHNLLVEKTKYNQ